MADNRNSKSNDDEGKDHKINGSSTNNTESENNGDYGSSHGDGPKPDGDFGDGDGDPGNGDDNGGKRRFCIFLNIEFQHLSIDKLNYPVLDRVR